MGLAEPVDRRKSDRPAAVDGRPDAGRCAGRAGPHRRRAPGVDADLTETDIAVPRAYVLFNGTTSAEPLGVQMQHVVNHAT